MRYVANWHAWLGLGGEMPQDALLTYLARWSCFDYGMVGFILWIIATDVVKYRPLVILTGLVFVIAAPVAVFIDTTAGMPMFWCIIESVGCLFVGSVLLGLCFAPSSNSSRLANKNT